MSTTKTSQAMDIKGKKIKNSGSTTIWVLTIFFSPHKASENETYRRSFVSKELAQEAMRREARRLYKNSNTIQEEESKHYDEHPMEVHFGESPNGSDYMREFGYCKVEPK